MKLKPIPLKERLTLNRNLRKRNLRRANSVKTPKSSEVKYRNQLTLLTKRMREDVATNIIPILKALESEYVSDSYARTLEAAFDKLRQLYEGIDKEAKIVSNSFVEGVDNVNKRRFYGAMEKAVGVDLSTVVQNEGLEDILVASTRENVSLIKSIPEEYFKKIETAVFNGTTRGSRATSMISEISKIGRVTTKRAKLIARDQSSKINSAISQQRQENLGVTEYVWRTAGDGDVRESHDRNNGKVFKWSNPPKDTGHPGHDIQCRCTAEPIINL